MTAHAPGLFPFLQKGNHNNNLTIRLWLSLKLVSTYKILKAASHASQCWDMFPAALCDWTLYPKFVSGNDNPSHSLILSQKLGRLDCPPVLLFFSYVSFVCKHACVLEVKGQLEESFLSFHSAGSSDHIQVLSWLASTFTR